MCIRIFRQEKIDSSADKRSLTPAKTLDNDATIEHREPCEMLVERCCKIDQAVRPAGINTPIICHENKQTNKMQRLRYFENMNLSIPIDIVRFSQGGGGGDPTVQSSPWFTWGKTVTI